jgi:hypothetical protein
MRKNHSHIILLLLIAFPFYKSSSAQTGLQELSATILQKDSLFWSSYNGCNIEQFRTFFSDDVEFYHDKGGITLGLEKLTQSLKNNLCGNPDFRLRREAIDGTVRVYPLQNSNVIYGAIISGEHVFYILEAGKKERLSGQARFSHLWLLKDSTWKMARVLSYDHGPAKYISKKKEVTLASNVIGQYTGIYEGPQSGMITVKRDGDLLIVTSSKGISTRLYPEADNRFFVKDRDLSFEFVKNERNKVSLLLVRENGELVEEARFKK